MKRFALLLLVLMMPLLMASGNYNPSDFPARYTTGAVLAHSGVIVAAPALLAGCEIYNSGASAEWIFFFDSKTVPADSTGGWTTSVPNGWKAWKECPATTDCFWGMNGPNIARGGSAVNFANGISWANSSTFPLKTIGSADDGVACSYTN